jgi:ribosomal 50S subunit-recycling heat shock protein
MTFAGEPREVNGQTVTPKAAATVLVDDIIAHDLAAKAENWEVEIYRTPKGGVRKRDVREWYKNHPEEQPDSEVPDSWNPEHHVDRRETPDS